MQVSEIKNEGLELHYKIVVPESEIAVKVNEKLQNLAKNVKMPGFRPGKVPLKLVEQKFKLSVFGEVVQEEIRFHVSKLADDTPFKLAAMPSVEADIVDPGKDVEFRVLLEKMPEIKDIDFAKIKLEKPVVKAKDSDIEDSIERIMSTKREFKKAAKTYKAADGDKAIIDFEGFVDGKAFAGGKGENYGLILGSKTFIPGFEEQVIGAKAGDDVLVKVAFPKEYGSKDLAGKEAEFKVKVHEVQKPEKAELDDTIAQSFGANNVEELKNQLRTMMEKTYEESSYTHQKMKLFDALENKLDFDVPPTLAKKEVEIMTQQLAQYKDEDEELKKKSESELKEYANKVALRRVRIGLMLADYAEKNQLKVTNDDYRIALMEKARSYPGNEKQVYDFYRDNQDAMRGLAGPILEDKAVRHILEHAVKSTVKEYSQDKFTKLMEELDN